MDIGIGQVKFASNISTVEFLSSTREECFIVARADIIFDSHRNKVASGLGREGKQDEAGVEGGDGEAVVVEEGDSNKPDQPKKKRIIKKNSIVEKNLQNINVTWFELDVLNPLCAIPAI